MIEAGANELYCGAIYKKLSNSYTRLGANSALGYTHCDLDNYKELEQAIEIAHSYNVPIFLVFNSRYYNKSQYEILLESIDKAIKLNIDALIISDIGLILTLKKIYNNIDIHASVISCIMNSKCVEFYKRLGVSRVTFQDSLKVSEIEQISKKEGKIQLEVFSLLTTPCPSVEGLCNFTHGVNNLTNDKSNISSYLLRRAINRLPKNLFNHLIKSKRINLGATPCSFTYKISSLNSHSKHKIQKANLNYSLQGCAACRLYKLNSLNINSIKIRGRGLPTNKKVLYTGILRKLIEYLNKKPNKVKFLQYSKKLCQQINLQKLHKCYYEYF
jgi:putative protease